MKRIFLWRIVAIGILAGIELGIVAGFAWPWSLLSPVAWVLIVYATETPGAFPWLAALFAGIIFDAFSIFPGGTFTLLFVALVGLTTFLFYRFFTNRSALVFGALGAIGAGFLFAGLVLVRLLTFFVTKDPLLTLEGRMVLHTLWAGILLNGVGLVVINFLWASLRERFQNRFRFRRASA